MIALFATVALNLLSNVIAAPYFQSHYGNGGIGVAGTTLATELFMVVIGVWLMPKGVIDRALAMTFLKIGIAGGVMVAAVIAAQILGIGTVARILIGAAVYVALALMTKALTPADILYVKNSALRIIRPSRADSSQ